MSKEPEQLAYKDFSAKVHGEAAQSDRVVKAMLEVTYRCNLRCRHCYTDPYNAPEHFSNELTFPEIKRILDEMADYGILWLNLSGGEVFARKDFFEIYEYAFRKGFVITVFTNGTVFTEAILDQLKKFPPFFVDVSCHSVNEASFDYFTQVPGSFKKFMKGMELLKTSGLPFRMKTKAMNWNAGEIPEVRKYVESLGQEFSFTTSLSPRLNGDLSSLELRLSPEAIEELETREKVWRDPDAACIERERGLSGTVPDKMYRCACATQTIHISARGELGTCVFEYESRASLRTHSLATAIDKVFREVRVLRYQSDSPCKTCRIYSFCDKTPTQLRWEIGDREASTPYHCDVAWNQARRFLGNNVAHPLRSASGKQ